MPCNFNFNKLKLNDCVVKYKIDIMSGISQKPNQTGSEVGPSSLQEKGANKHLTCFGKQDIQTVREEVCFKLKSWYLKFIHLHYKKNILQEINGYKLVKSCFLL